MLKFPPLAHLKEKICQSLERLDAARRMEAELSRRLGAPWEEIARRWGFERLRRGQGEALEQILLGRDVLMVMPTGAGKSLIYQLASQCLPGLTVVVSPLIALISDQIMGLRRRGIAAVGLHSHNSPEENRSCLEQALRGEARLLYLAPERLRSTSFRQTLSKASVSLFVVDEAHCITHWGHDFRPDYLTLARAVSDLGGPPVAALTATATPAAQREIATLLSLHRPFIKATGFDRPNLRFACLEASSQQKVLLLSRLLRDAQGPSLIYAGTRKATEEICAQLSLEVRRPVLCYHGGMAAGQRQEALESFLQLPDLVMVATNAFGMGVDRPDLSLVLHHSLPGSLESYYQEAGRAGRGGQAARAILLYHKRDRALHEYFIRESTYNEKQYQDLYLAIREGRPVSQHTHRVGLDHLQRQGVVESTGSGWRILKTWSASVAQGLVGISERIRKVRLEQLQQMEAYVQNPGCRRKKLVNHFGEMLFFRPQQCCDRCDRAA